MAAIPSSRHPDFERVKQKFDKPITSNSPSSSASSNTRNGKKARNFSSFLKFSNRRTSDSVATSNCDVVSQKAPNNSNLTESLDSVDSTKAIAGDSLSNKKIDAYMHSSINIDGLKVSDDEEVSILSHGVCLYGQRFHLCALTNSNCVSQILSRVLILPSNQCAVQRLPMKASKRWLLFLHAFFEFRNKTQQIPLRLIS